MVSVGGCALTNYSQTCCTIARVNFSREEIIATALNLRVPDVSFPVRAAALTSVVLFVDATGSGCTNSVKICLFVMLALRLSPRTQLVLKYVTGKGNSVWKGL